MLIYIQDDEEKISSKKQLQAFASPAAWTWDQTTFLGLSIIHAILMIIVVFYTNFFYLVTWF